MKLLLDTHVLLWWTTADRRLKTTVRNLIASSNNYVAVSAASIWEIAIKVALGRIAIDLAALLTAVAADGFEEIPVRAAHAVRLPSLAPIHADPFDRLLICQAVADGYTLVTADDRILRYADVSGLELLQA